MNPLGCWKGIVELGGATVEGSFEVFDSARGWDFLFGKQLMTTFSAIHDYATDEVFLPMHQCTLQNQHDIAIQPPQTANQVSQVQEENERGTKKGDNAQSPVRGVLIDHIQTNLPVIDMPTSDDRPPHEDTKPQEQQPTTTGVQGKEQVTLMGDKVISPSREVQNTVPMGDKPPADNELSHSPSIEEIHDINMPEFNTEEKETTEAPKERAREGARGLWRKWKGWSQRRHCRWKTRNANIARAK